MLLFLSVHCNVEGLRAAHNRLRSLPAEGADGALPSKAAGLVGRRESPVRCNTSSWCLYRHSHGRTRCCADRLPALVRQRDEQRCCLCVGRRLPCEPSFWKRTPREVPSLHGLHHHHRRVLLVRHVLSVALLQNRRRCQYVNRFHHLLLSAQPGT